MLQMDRHLVTVFIHIPAYPRVGGVGGKLLLGVHFFLNLLKMFFENISTFFKCVFLQHFDLFAKPTASTARLIAARQAKKSSLAADKNAAEQVNRISVGHNKSGVDVMITIFGDFCQFSAKKWRFL
jgi:hypothetical protein